MKTSTRLLRLVLTNLALIVAFLCAPTRAAHAGETPVKAALYGVRIEPRGTDAENFGRAGWGGGIRMVVSPSALQHGIGFGAGFEIVNLLDQTIQIYDPQTLLRVEHTTSQEFFRVSLGGELGPHGHGFFRPFVGANVAVHIYTIGTQLTIPDDTNPDQSLHQDLGSETNAAFGYDFTVGCDLQYRRFFLEGGARFLKSFNVPQQLTRAGAVTIHPAYLQAFIGLGGTIW